MKVLRFVVLIALFFVAGTPVGLAHETRRVAEKFDVVVGFTREPAFSGDMNGVDLRVTRGRQPIEGLQDSLRVAVFYQDREGESLKLKFEPKYNDPGRYTAHFLPTQAGKYVFHIKGKIKGIPADEWFESGPETFSEVRESEPLRFP